MVARDAVTGEMNIVALVAMMDLRLMAAVADVDTVRSAWNRSMTMILNDTGADGVEDNDETNDNRHELDKCWTWCC